MEGWGWMPAHCRLANFELLFKVGSMRWVQSCVQCFTFGLTVWTWSKVYLAVPLGLSIAWAHDLWGPAVVSGQCISSACRNKELVQAVQDYEPQLV